MATSEESVPHVCVFVYGTLRVGEYNAGDYDPTWRVERDCHIKGDIYFVSPNGGYPVADLEGTGTVVGDLICAPVGDPWLEWTGRMERGAGYELRPVVVTLADGTEVEASAWHYLRLDHAGPQIVDGDWRAASRSRSSL